MRTAISSFLVGGALLGLGLLGSACGGGSTSGAGSSGQGGGSTSGASSSGQGGAPSSSSSVDASSSSGAGGVVDPGAKETIVTYAGGAGDERFEAVAALSDGSFLLGGGATDLDWVPAGAKNIEISAAGINAASAGHVGFLLHMSPDLQSILEVVHFPKATVRDIARIRFTSRPGEPTGQIFISGRRDAADTSQDGYYIARLDNNFVNGAPSKAVWTFDAKCPPSQAAGGTGESAYKNIQPWDVGGDGRVVYGEGAEYDFKWAQIQRLSPDGAPEVVENWRAHWTASTEWDGTPASSHAGADPLIRSAIVMKAGRKGSLRSSTQADHDVLLPDGNGRTDRQGRFPDDYYFSGPCDFAAASCPGGPGYTGYSTSDKPTQRVGGIAVDRASGDMYIGYSTQSKLPGGQPDFEPAVVAMDNTGKLKWWSRLYHEKVEKAGGGFDTTSSPDQYVDHLAIDYSANALVVLARAHGNNVINFWSGDEVAKAPGTSAFHDRFTGMSGNIHISWLGKLDLADGSLARATWNAEYAEGTGSLGAPYGDPNLDGWPSHNAGWPDLNTTKVRAMSVDAAGRVYLTAEGRRSITTSTAYQKMPKPSEGKSGWNGYVRVYAADLSTLVYSSILRGPWEPTMDGGGGNVTLNAVFPLAGGVIAVGFHGLDDATKLPAGVPMPTSNTPPWGAPSPAGESAVLAHLLFK